MCVYPCALCLLKELAFMTADLASLGLPGTPGTSPVPGKGWEFREQRWSLWGPMEGSTG